MASEWPDVVLDEITELRNGAGVKQKHFADTGVPLLVFPILRKTR